MKNIQKKNNSKRRNYSKPSVKRIRLDNEISMVMMSPPPDPRESIQPDHFSVNPFKISKL